MTNSVGGVGLLWMLASVRGGGERDLDREYDRLLDRDPFLRGLRDADLDRERLRLRDFVGDLFLSRLGLLLLLLRTGDLEVLRP